MKPKIRKAFDPERNKNWKGEKNTMPSLTKPDQSLTVQQILDRFASGRPVGGGYEEVYYGGEDDPPHWERMDYAERQSYRENVQDELDKVKKDHAQKQREINRRKRKQQQRSTDVKEGDKSTSNQSASQSNTQDKKDNTEK